MGAELERNYECPRCGMKAIVVIEAEASMSPWRRMQEGSITGPDGLARQDDATHALGLIRCPGCAERPRLAMFWSALRVLGYAVGSVIAVNVIGPFFLRRAMRAMMPLEWSLAVFWLAAVFGLVVEIRRWGAAGKARVVRMIGAPPEKTLPRARVVARAPSVPPPVVTAPPPAPVIVPMASAPPPVIAPAAPDDGPRFLKP